MIFNEEKNNQPPAPLPPTINRENSAFGLNKNIFININGIL